MAIKSRNVAYHVFHGGGAGSTAAGGISWAMLGIWPKLGSSSKGRLGVIRRIMISLPVEGAGGTSETIQVIKLSGTTATNLFSTAPVHTVASGANGDNYDTDGVIVKGAGFNTPVFVKNVTLAEGDNLYCTFTATGTYTTAALINVTVLVDADV
jgi:hypothetical protein